MNTVTRLVREDELSRSTVFLIPDGSDISPLFGGVVIGVCSTDNHRAKQWYADRDREARLAAKVGIDNYDDGCAFTDWWALNRASLEHTYGRYKHSVEDFATFSDFVRIVFLEHLNPMSEDDVNNSWEYNDSSVQDWLVMGEYRSARVMVNSWHGLEFDESSMSYRIHYTPGDNPTFSEFSNLEALNKEINQWTR